MVIYLIIINIIKFIIINFAINIIKFIIIELQDFYGFYFLLLFISVGGISTAQAIGFFVSLSCQRIF